MVAGVKKGETVFREEVRRGAWEEEAIARNGASKWQEAERGGGGSSGEAL